MRKWRFTRPVRSEKSMVILALLITVLVHAVFLLFNYRTPQVNTGETGTGMQTLNIKNLPSEQQNKLLNWIALHDPQKIAASFSNAGYSALHEPQKWFRADIQPFKIREIRYENDVSAFSPLPLYKRMGTLPPETEYKVPEISAKRAVTAMDQSGRILKNFLPEIPDHSGYVSPTVIRIERFGKLCSISLLSSSGNAELDRAAAAAAVKFETKAQDTITVIWPAVEEKNK